MRKRNLALLIVPIIFLAILSTGFFLFYTSPGTSLVLTTIGRLAPGIHIDRYTGTLGTALRVDGLSAKFGDTTVNVASVYVKWRTARLLLGQIIIDDLQARDLTIMTGKKSEEKPVDLTLPQLPRLFTLFHGWIYSIDLNKLTLRSPGKEPTVIGHSAASVVLNRGVAYLNIYSVKTDLGNIAGKIIMNLVRPGIRARLEAKPFKSSIPIDALFLDANLPPGHGKEQIAGPVNIKAMSGKRDRLRVATELGLEKQKVNLRNLKITKGTKEGTVTGNGQIDLSGKKTLFDMAVNLAGLDLGPELPIHTKISGTASARGIADDFTGKINIANKGESWKDVTFSANVRGLGDLIRFENLNSSIYGGNIAGSAEFNRGPEMTVALRVTGKDINPARIKRGLEGNLNFFVDGRLEKFQDAPMEGYVKAVVRDSQFQKKNVSADIDASFKNELIDIKTFNARGAGFAVNAHGIVQRQVEFMARIDDASLLFPGTKGSVLAQGWARYRDNQIAGVLTARGNNIAASSLKAGSFQANIQIPGGVDGPLSADIVGKNLSYEMFRSETMNLSIKGSMADHRISFLTLYREFRVEALANGAYSDGTWQGTIQKLAGSEKTYSNWQLTRPSDMRISADEFFLSPFVIASAAGENLALNARLRFDPLTGFVDARWNGINLGRTNRLFQNITLTGQSTGYTRLEWLSDKRMIITGETNTAGTYSQGSLKNIKMSMLGKINWDRSGLKGSLDAGIGDKGRITAGVTSKQPARPAFPDQGTFDAQWTSLDLKTIQPLIGDTVSIKGYVSGSTRADLLPQKRFTCKGNMSVSGGYFSWRNEQGEITAPVEKAALDWSWQDRLKGTLNLALARYGNTQAVFDLPVPARLPVIPDKNSPMQFTASGALHEQGLFAALVPGIAQETKGQIDFNVRGSGTFSDPVLNGALNLTKASAYIPVAGLDLKEISANINFNNDRIIVSSLIARTDTGYINATGTIQHAAFRIQTFEGDLKGDRFHIVHLPEVNALVSPDLTFRGDPKNIMVRGSIQVPEALISEQEKRNVIKPSDDVVIVGQEEEQQKLPFGLDISVMVIMGNNVAVKAYGIDTLLAGSVNVMVTDPNNVRAKGTISTVQGKYDAYGVKLNIRRGTITFGGGLVQNANLDILAVRRIDDPNAGIVVAGVTISGTPSSPVINLYSSPSMSEMDTLSYVVLGRPSGPGGQGDTALLAKVGSSLLTGGKLSSLQKALALDIDVGSTQTGGASESIAKVGRYLSPKLYISFGRSIYTGQDVFGIRYRLTRNIELETTVGMQNSGAIYYRVEFE